MTNERWYSFTAEEAEKKLNTNVSFGLDPKEAERRRRRGESGSIYGSASQSPIYHASRIASDITVILFILTAVISVFFGGGRMAAASVAFAVISLFASVLTYAVSKRRFENMAEYSYPFVKVLRGGRVYLIDGRDVVTGDVLLLSKGDVLPCDCRLVSTENMRAIEFVGKLMGKEKKAVTEKDALAVISPESKPNAAAQKNMIGASSVIISGSGRAIAVRTGRKTFVSLMLGELEICPDKKRDMRVLGEISRLLSKIALSLLIMAVPFSLLAMFIGGKELHILDVLLAFLALAFTLGSEIIGGILYLFPANVMKKSPGLIKYPDAIEEMNYLDSVMLFGSSSLKCREKKVESIFASNRFYDVERNAGTNDDALNCLLDLAVLGSAHYFGMGSIGGTDPYENAILKANAVRSLANACGIDTKKLLSDYELAEFSGASASGFDTSLVKKDSEYRVICVSDSEELLGICTHIRTPDGAVYLEADKKADIVRACRQLVKKAKCVTLVASRISPCSSLSRLGAIQNQLIFEGYIVYSDPYTDGVAEDIIKMREADISLYYISEENAESVIDAFNIGAVKGKSEIAYASSFKRLGKDILSDFGKYRAYLGFTAKETETLARAIRGSDGTLAVIASDTDKLIYINQANVSAALADIRDRGSALTSASEYSEILKKSSDILLEAPTKENGGFKSFSDEVLASKSACTGLCKFLRYMAFSGTLRIFLTVIPLVTGSLLLTAPQLMFFGAFIDIAAALCFAECRHVHSFDDSISDIETETSKPFKSLLKYIVLGGVFGAVMLMMALVFGTAGIASGSLLSAFAFFSVALSQMFALYIIADFPSGTKGKKFILLQTLIVTGAILLALLVPSVGSFVGVAYPGWQLLASAPLISVIGFVMILVTDRYI